MKNRQTRGKTRELPTREHLHELFNYEEDGSLTNRTTRGGRVVVGARTGYVRRRDGYRQATIAGQLYLEHRVVWMWHHGTVPPFLDHIDRDKTNNRIENLRPATTTENARNAAKRTGASSRWKGVSWRERDAGWRATIRLPGGVKHLGTFLEEADAAMAYNEAAFELFGVFAALNEAEQT